MDKKTVKTIIVALILILFCLYFVSCTYSRYTSARTGNASITVAKWAVAFKNGSADLTDNFTLNLTVEDNDNVVSEKIAPATTASADINVDLTGTEVAVDLIATIKKADLENLFGTSAVTATMLVDGAEIIASDDTSTETISLVSDSAFTADNGVKKVTIKVVWDNADDANNESDTTVGTTAGTLELPVTLTVQQHIG